MKRLRIWAAILMVWLFFFYNIERLSEPINVATFVYVFVVVSILVVLLVKPLMHVRSYWLYLAALPIYIGLKLAFRYEILGTNLPLTVTEMAAIGLSIMLAGQVVNQLNEIEDVFYRLTLDTDGKETQHFEIGQSQIYREIRRARKLQRPLTILAVSVSEASFELNLNRFLKEFERDVTKRYINARIGTLLLDRLHSTDIVTQRNNHFVVLLPETGKQEAFTVINRLETIIGKDLGLTLKIGRATFPEEATTFDQLLESAENQMKQAEGETTSLAAQPTQSEDMRVPEGGNS